MLRHYLLAAAILIASGCSSTYQHSELQAPSTKLNSSKGVLISVPEDGWYENIHYRNSGIMTANAIRAAFAKNAHRVSIAKGCHGEMCMEDIDTHRYGYYIKPVILHWEDRATEWSGKPDRIEIQLVIFDVVTKSEIANYSYTGKSKWATFGGDHPQDLLPTPTNQYVSSLYH